MKTITILLFFIFYSAQVFSQSIIISGLGHGYDNRNSGLVELYVLNDITTDAYIVKATRPDNSVIGSTYLSPPLTAGTYITLAQDDFYFQPFFGYNPTDPYSYVGYINGDDTVTLEDINGEIIDIYGALGVDGFGTAWEYSRGWAYRLPGFGPNTTFTLSEWNIMDDAFIGCDPNSACSPPYPNGTYTLSNAQYSLKSIRLTPNPVDNDMVKILGVEHNNPVNVKIYDTFGKLMLDKMMEDETLNISAFQTGIYFVKVQQDTNINVEKLIVK